MIQLSVLKVFLHAKSHYIYKFVLATFIARLQSLPMNVFKTAYTISLRGREYMIDFKNDSNFSQNDKQENDDSDYYSLQEEQFPLSLLNLLILEIKNIELIVLDLKVLSKN